MLCVYTFIYLYACMANGSRFNIQECNGQTNIMIAKQWNEKIFNHNLKEPKKII